MLEWLSLPIDPERVHAVGFYIAWHARLMTLAWGIFVPLGVLLARYFKVMPGQDFPNEVNNLFWWYGHQALQYSALALMVVALGLIYYAPAVSSASKWHSIFAYSALVLAGVQLTSGLLRGTRGGPDDVKKDATKTIRGDHYDMTRRRIIFEYIHKFLGYGALLSALIALYLGLWQANAPRWMWIILISWHSAIGLAFAIFQKQGKSIDTYQALWGPDMDHPGNQIKPIGFGIKRIEK